MANTPPLNILVVRGLAILVQQQPSLDNELLRHAIHIPRLTQNRSDRRKPFLGLANSLRKTKGSFNFLHDLGVMLVGCFEPVCVLVDCEYDGTRTEKREMDLVTNSQRPRP